MHLEQDYYGNLQVKMKIKNIIFYGLFMLLILPIAFADVRTFPNTITITTYNGSVNATTEQDTHTYNCMSNTTSSFTFDLKRNLTTDEELRDAIDDLKDTTKLCDKVSTLDMAVQQYGDINTYFKLYTQCNADALVCDKVRTDCLAKVTELTPFKTNYEACAKTLEERNNQVNQYSNIIIPAMQTNLTSMSSSLNQSEKGKWLWFFFGIGIMGIIMVIREKKRSPTLQRHKTLGLQGGTSR